MSWWTLRQFEPKRIEESIPKSLFWWPGNRYFRPSLAGGLVEWSIKRNWVKMKNHQNSAKEKQMTKKSKQNQKQTDNDFSSIWNTRKSILRLNICSWIDFENFKKFQCLKQMSFSEVERVTLSISSDLHMTSIYTFRGT